MPGVRLVLLGIGPKGCAALAAHVTEHGVERVSAVVLIEPSAPWAEREDADAACPGEDCGFCIGETCNKCGAGMRSRPFEPACEHDVDQRHEGVVRHRGHLSLGPLEPLRALAENAREGIECPRCPLLVGHRVMCGQCLGFKRIYPLRLILAVSIESPPCSRCRGRRRLVQVTNGKMRGVDCPDCSATGRVLPSAEVAEELCGRDIDLAVELRAPYVDGALEVHVYETRAALAEHGLEAALKVAVEGLC